MRRLALGAVLTAFLATGCGDGGPPLVSVHGKVTLDGKPLARKSVRFVPEPGTPGVGAGANTGEDGSYTLLAVRPGATRDTPGVPPGKYRVVVSEPVFPIEASAAPEADGSPAPAIGLPDARPRKKPSIPAAYGSPDTTKLHVEVKPDGGVIDLALSSKP